MIFKIFTTDGSPVENISHYYLKFPLTYPGGIFTMEFRSYKLQGETGNVQRCQGSICSGAGNKIYDLPVISRDDR